MGTGNYNPSTAKTYTDYSLFTSKAAFTADMANLFNTLTGYTRKPVFKKLLVAPFNLHESMVQKIEHESKAAKTGKDARIIIKVNSLIDPEIIKSLYSASQCGVQIDLIIRGICGLVPGVKGLSENIRVRSLLGRFLEHSRVYYFQNSPVGENTYLGSPDWMPRNFFRRVEVVFPVEDPDMQKEVLKTMEEFLYDNTFASELRQNGKYVAAPKRKRTPFSVQEKLITATMERQSLQEKKVSLGRSPGETENQGKTNQKKS